MKLQHRYKTKHRKRSNIKESLIKCANCNDVKEHHIEQIDINTREVTIICLGNPFKNRLCQCQKFINQKILIIN